MAANTRFWSKIEVLGGIAIEESVIRLERALRALDDQHLEEFANTLRATLESLTQISLDGLPVSDCTDPQDADPVPLAGDALRYFIYAVVASGQSRYEQTLKNPASISDGCWEFSEAEFFIDAVSDVLWERLGIGWADVDPTLSADAPAEETAESPEPWWYIPAHGSYGELPKAYHQAVIKSVTALNSSAIWRAWWDQSALERVEANIFIGANQASIAFKKGKKAVKMQVEMTSTYFDGRGDAELSQLALDEISYIMTAVSERLGLGVIPPIPEIESRA